MACTGTLCNWSTRPCQAVGHACAMPYLRASRVPLICCGDASPMCSKEYAAVESSVQSASCDMFGSSGVEPRASPDAETTSDATHLQRHGGGLRSWTVWKGLAWRAEGKILCSCSGVLWSSSTQCRLRCGVAWCLGCKICADSVVRVSPCDV